jgi:hypothetical protein
MRLQGKQMGFAGRAVPDPWGSLRPAHNVAVKVALCGEFSGVLVIGPSGAASVQAAGGVWSNVQCQTALDGVWFVR